MLSIKTILINLRKYASLRNILIVFAKTLLQS